MSTEQPANNVAAGKVGSLSYAGGKPPADGKIDAWFAYTVGILLLAIIAALTTLMFRYRSTASIAQVELDRANRTIGLIQSMPPLIPALGPANYTPAPDRVTVNGQEVKALRMDPGVGGLIGLVPGDVVLVEGVATSNPESTPQTQPVDAP